MFGASMEEEKVSKRAHTNYNHSFRLQTAKRANYLPLRELSTAFSINSMIVCDLNLAHEPNENVPTQR